MQYNTQGEDLVNYYAKLERFETEATEIYRVQKMYDYLKNDSKAIRFHLHEYLGKIVNEKTLNLMPLVWLNEVPRIINRRCLVYKKPAMRTLDAENTQNKYSEVTKSLDKWAKEFHKQGKLFNTILVRPIWDKVKKQLSWQILTRNICDVEYDENFNVLEVKYMIELEDEKTGEEKTYIIHWTDTEHFATEQDSDKHVKLEMINDNEKNPYGVIPYVVLRFEDCADFWGDGMPDLVEGQEALNGRLTDMFYKLYMSFGQAVGTNLGINKQDYFIGYDTPILVDGIREDMLLPDLKFITPEHKVELDQAVSDWFKNQLANTKGLPSNGIRYTSGYEREVDNYELLDLNEDDKEILRPFEQDLFEMNKLVLKHDANIDLGSVKMTLEFSAIEFRRTEDEVWKRRESEYKYNMSTPIDWLKETNPKKEDTELKGMLQNNRLLKIELGGATPSLFEIANNRTGAE